jgi:ribose transport system substrate-binding protein
MKKLMLVVMMIGLLALTGNSLQAAKKQYRVTLIVKNLVNPTWIAVKRGAEAAAAKYGVRLTVLAPLRNENNEEQITQVEQAIAKREDAIVLVPADSKGIIPAVEKANQANIPVINVNTKVEETKNANVATFIAVENYDAACKVANELAKQLKKKGKVIILEGKTGSQSAVDIATGAADTFKKYPKIKVVAKQTAQWSRSEALTVTQNLLQAYPNVDAIFGSNDEMALGAVEAVDQAKKIGKILVAGLDANEDAVKAILLGRMHITCDKKSYDQGYYGVAYAVKVLKKQKVAKFIPVKTELITKDNINKYKVK